MALINLPEIATISKQAGSDRLTIVLHRLLRSLEIDQSVAMALLTRAWQALAGLVSLLLIARYFSPAVQGFYYTFASLLAFQSFVELGLYLVIINVASHEWARLSLGSDGQIVGDPEALSRLVGLGRFVFKWYAVASGLFILGVGLAGYAFFSKTAYFDIQWQAPWWSAVILTGLVLWSLPFTSLLEGCNQVASINQFRLIQAILGSLALWLTILIGGGLWATVVLAGMNVLCALYLLLLRYRRFFQPLFIPPVGPSIRWRTEIWPMQWRLALQGLVNYFMYSLFTPVMFHYHGAVIAGQMGMTWQLVSMLQVSALVWVQTKVPQFGILIAQKDYVDLDRLWWRSSLISLAFISGVSGVVFLLVYGLNVIQAPLAQRLLGPLPTGLFLLAAILAQIIQCQAAYLRAHKRDPLVIPGVIAGVATGLLVWGLGSRFGATGAAAAYLLVITFVSVPLITFIWSRSRAEWHSHKINAAISRNL